MKRPPRNQPPPPPSAHNPDAPPEVSWDGPESLRGMLRSIDSLKADPKNARVHNTGSLDSLKASLSRFGQQKPLVANADGVVVAGNGTLEAAKAAGWTHVAVLVSNLDAKEVRAFALADNRTADLSSFDNKLLYEALIEFREEDGLLDFDESLFSDGYFTKLSSEFEKPGAALLEEFIDPTPRVPAALLQSLGTSTGEAAPVVGTGGSTSAPAATPEAEPDESRMNPQNSGETSTIELVIPKARIGELRTKLRAIAPTAGEAVMKLLGMN